MGLKRKGIVRDRWIYLNIQKTRNATFFLERGQSKNQGIYTLFY